MDNVAVNRMIPGIKWQQPQTDAFPMCDLVPHSDYSFNWSWSFSFLLIKSATGCDSTERKKYSISERLLSPFPNIFTILFNSCSNIRLRIEQWARFFVRPVRHTSVVGWMILLLAITTRRNHCFSSADNQLLHFQIAAIRTNHGYHESVNFSDRFSIRKVHCLFTWVHISFRKL